MAPNLRKTVKNLSESEAKSLLLLILHRIQMLHQVQRTGQNHDSTEKLVSDLYRMYDALFRERTKEQPKEPARMIHIVFDASTAGSLRVALRKRNLEPEESIVALDDFFSIGPIRHLHEESGMRNRQEWLRNRINSGDDYYEDEYLPCFRRAVEQIGNLDSRASVTVWHADIAHEQVGLRFVLFLLQNRPNEIALINTTKASESFHTPTVRIDYRHSGEIAPDKLARMLEDDANRKPLDRRERERFEREWLRLAEHPSVLRLWKDGQIRHAEEDHFDPFLIDTIRARQRRLKTKDFIKTARIVSEAIGHLDQYVGDGFLEYRIRQLVYKGVLEIEGIPKGMRYYGIRLKEM